MPSLETKNNTEKYIININSNISLSDLHLLIEKEKKKILNSFNEKHLKK